MAHPSNEIDMAEADHVAWVKSQTDPALWHLAAMAALAYRGDDFGFLKWLLKQPDMDRATAGWMFFWPEGSTYLSGETAFPLDNISSERMLDLFRALCQRSEEQGFGVDRIGLDKDFEAERIGCLDVIAQNKVAAGLFVPHQIIDRPYARTRIDQRYTMDDGIILL